MTIRSAITCLSLLLVFASGSATAEKHKYPKLKPADPPCLFLLDEDTGNPTGNPVNPPCELGGTVMNQGDIADPELRKKYGKTENQAKAVKKKM